MKDDLTNPSVLKFFDAGRPAVLSVDASKSGLGAACLSLSLSLAEKWYFPGTRVSIDYQLPKAELHGTEVFIKPAEKCHFSGTVSASQNTQAYSLIAPPPLPPGQPSPPPPPPPFFFFFFFLVPKLWGVYSDRIDSSVIAMHTFTQSGTLFV